MTCEVWPHREEGVACAFEGPEICLQMHRREHKEP